MSDFAQEHLTDEQFSDCVLMTPDPATRAHLAACGACRNELEIFSASTAAFEEASMAWSHAQPRPNLRPVVQTQRRNSFLAPAAWAFAAAAFVAVALPAWQHAHENAISNVAPRMAAQPDSSAQIADDNKLMEAVNIALAAEEPSPLAEYRVSAPGKTGGKSRLESSY